MRGDSSCSVIRFYAAYDFLLPSVARRYVYFLFNFSTVSILGVEIMHVSGFCLFLISFNKKQLCLN